MEALCGTGFAKDVRMWSVDLQVTPCPALCCAEDFGDIDKGCMHGDLLHTEIQAEQAAGGRHRNS